MVPQFLGALLRLLRFVFSGFDFEIFLQAEACRRSLQPAAFSFIKSIYQLCVFVKHFLPLIRFIILSLTFYHCYA